MTKPCLRILRIGAAITLLGAPASLHAQGWSRGYDFERDLGPLSSTVRADGGAVCVGWTGFGDAAGLLDLDAGGNPIRSSFHEAGSYGLAFIDSLELPGGDLFVVGWNDAGGPVLARLNAAREFVWAKEIVDNYVRPRQLVPLDDGDVLVAGTTLQSRNEDFAALRVSQHGTIRWQSKYGGPEPETVLGACSDGANGAVLVGRKRSSVDEGWMIRLGSAGFPVWQRRVLAAEGLSVHDIERRGDGSYFVLGEEVEAGVRGAFVARFSATGSPIWSRKFRRGVDTEVGALCRTRDDEVVVLGHDEHGGNRIWLAQLDGNGTVRWQREHETLHDDEVVTSVDLDRFANDDLLVTAATAEYENADPWLLRLSAQGSLGSGCPRETEVADSTLSAVPEIRLTEQYQLALDGSWSSMVGSQSAADWDEWVSCSDVFVPWSDEGQGLAGNRGVPRLAGLGRLEQGSPAHVVLTRARPYSRGYLVLGFGRVDLPFKGGTLVPDADFILGQFAFGLRGELQLGTRIPAGLPGGLELVLQALVLDSAAPEGVALSNAIQAITP